MIGIYCIYCKKSNKRYIGSSKNIEYRWRQHIAAFQKGIRTNPYLQNEWDKYGIDNFEFIIVEQMEYYDNSILIEREQYWIDYYHTMDREYGYNLQSADRHEVSIETRKKLSNSLKGKKNSKEARSKMSKKLKGRKFTDEHKNKISESLKGYKCSDERKKNISLGVKKTHKPITDEQRKKKSLLLKERWAKVKAEGKTGP
jgi:group I intron endonuclease